MQWRSQGGGGGGGGGNGGNAPNVWVNKMLITLCDPSFSQFRSQAFENNHVD